jgi:hypothetical protein
LFNAGLPRTHGGGQSLNTGDFHPKKISWRGNKSRPDPVSLAEVAEYRNGGAIAAWRHDYLTRRIQMLNMRSAAIAVITSASLSLLAMSAAQAGQDGKETSAVGISVKKQQIPHKIYNTARTPFVVDRQVGPAAFSGANLVPEFSPDYHGSNGG